MSYVNCRTIFHLEIGKCTFVNVIQIPISHVQLSRGQAIVLLVSWYFLFTCSIYLMVEHIVLGKYALITPPLNVAFNHTYSIVVNNTGSVAQCLNFYSYFTSKAYNSIIHVGWDEGVEPHSPMVGVTAIDDNKWQQSWITLTGMLSSNYRVSDFVSRCNQIYLIFTASLSNSILDCIQNGTWFNIWKFPLRFRRNQDLWWSLRYFIFILTRYWFSLIISVSCL
jgi:hypothetical protein